MKDFDDGEPLNSRCLAERREGAPELQCQECGKDIEVGWYYDLMPLNPTARDPIDGKKFDTFYGVYHIECAVNGVLADKAVCAEPGCRELIDKSKQYCEKHLP